VGSFRPEAIVGAIERIAWKVGLRENRFHTLTWSSTPFIELLVERFNQDGEWSQQKVLVPGWGLNYLTANAPARPTRGLRLRGEVAGAYRGVLSDASFLRFYFNGKKILPFSERGRLLVRGEAGWMATDDFDKVPPSWRFFAGGDRSVRGYDYQSLGPLDDETCALRAHIASLVPCDSGFPVTVDEILNAIGTGRLPQVVQPHLDAPGQPLPVGPLA